MTTSNEYSLLVNKTDTHLTVECSKLQSDIMRDLPGSKYVSREGHWTLPLSYVNWIPFFSALGQKIEASPAVKEWVLAQHARELELHALRYDSRPAEEGRLRPKQAEAVAWMNHAWHGIIGDEPGSGKTPMACTILNTTPPIEGHKFHGMVVAPKGTLKAWVEHVKEWTDHEPILCLGSPKVRKALIDNWLQDGGVLITNFALVSTHTRLAHYGSTALKKCSEHGGHGDKITPAKCQVHLKELDMVAEVGGLDVLVVDEAQALMDPSAVQTRAIKWLGSKYARRRIALTGTPSSGKPESIWSLLHFVDPTCWPAKGQFLDRYCVMAMNYATGQEYPVAIKNEDEFYRVRDMFMVRRTFEEVTGRQIEKVYQTITCQLSPKHRKQYKQIATETLVEMESGTLTIPSPMVAATRLAQCSSAMLDVENTEEVTEEGYPVQRVWMKKPAPKVDLLWEFWDSTLGRKPLVVMAGGKGSRQIIDIAIQHFIDKDVRVARVVGGMTAEEQGHEVERYMKGEADVFFGQTSAAGAGLNLHRGNTLAYLQLPDKLIEVEQSENRVRRQNQEAESVLIVNLVAEDTYDERQHELYRNNKEVYDQVLADPSQITEMF